MVNSNPKQKLEALLHDAVREDFAQSRKYDDGDEKSLIEAFERSLQLTPAPSDDDLGKLEWW